MPFSTFPPRFLRDVALNKFAGKFLPVRQVGRSSDSMSHIPLIRMDPSLEPLDSVEDCRVHVGRVLDSCLMMNGSE
jgi:hypothetical protein